MRRTATQYGVLWVCRAESCTVSCWDGPTSTPADKETRQARHRLHQMFDPLWKDNRGPFSEGKRPNVRPVRRDRAYRWLAKSMGLRREHAHFGMFNLDQCRQAESLIGKLARKAVPA